MQRIHGDDALRTDIRNAVLAQLDQSHTDAQRAILTSYIPDDDLQNIQDAFLEQRKHMTDFSRTPTTLYPHVLTALLQQQQDAYIAKSENYAQEWDAMILEQQESIVRHGFDQPFYVDCDNQEERIECMRDFKEELTAYALHDASFQPELQELESDGSKEPRVRQRRMNNRLTDAISNPVKYKLDALIQEREDYWAEQMHAMRADVTIHEPLYEQVRAEMQQSFTPTQQTAFENIDFDISGEHLDDVCGNRWNNIVHFPANAQEVYTQILRLTLEQQWQAHCVESGEVAQWVGDGSESIVETLRRNDELDRDNLHRDWMDNRDKYMREDYDLHVLRNSLENAK